MTISRRLQLLVAIAIASLLILAGINVYQMNRVFDAASFGNENVVPSIRLLNTVTYEMGRARVRAYRYTIQTDPADRAKLDTMLQEARTMMDKALKDYEPLVANEEDRKMLEAERASLAEYNAHIDEALALARAGRLTPADVQHGTFTISNHGVSGSLTASPIVINQPQSAILGVGKVEKRVVVREVQGADAMLIRPMAYVTLTIDHRVIDGAQTNAWLTRFVETIEHWPAAAGAR